MLWLLLYLKIKAIELQDNFLEGEILKLMKFGDFYMDLLKTKFQIKEDEGV